MRRNNRFGSKRNNGLNGLILKLVISLLFLITPLLIIANVSGDGGMIPYHEFSVYEPGQKAIIACDGQEEIMILSVDVYSEQSTKALHMVPFPSLPEVELGTVESFDKIEEIINRDRWEYDGEYDRKNGNYSIAAPGIENVEIVFHEKVGAHDITAVKINSPIEFSKWVNNFLKDNGIKNKELPDELNTVVAHYTDLEIRYFVFDVIELEANTRSVNPIVYKFETDYLFFPLEISSIIKGSTEITLALITPDDLPINSRSLSELGFGIEYDDFISFDDLRDVNIDITNMFDEISCLRVYQGYFSLEDLKNDVVMKRLANVNWMIAEQSRIGSPDIADLNGDGKKEIIVQFGDRKKVYDAINGIIIEDKDHPDNNIKYLGEGATKNVFYYTGGVICSLNEDGEIFWIHHLNATNKNNIKEIVVAQFDNKDFDVLVFYNTAILSKLDGHNGKELWTSHIHSRYYDYLIENIDNEKTKEIIYWSNNNLFILDSQTGESEWTTVNIDNRWNNIYNFNSCDFDNDGISEIFVYSPPTIYILDGNTGSIIKKFDLDVEELGPSYIKQVEIGDFDDDNDIEYLLATYTKLVVLDDLSGPIIWNFTTGEYISEVKVEDLDNDNNDEIVMTTQNNRLYTIEYVQGSKSTSNGKWIDTQGILIGSIILPTILTVILIILIVRALDMRERRYKD